MLGPHDERRVSDEAPVASAPSAGWLVVVASDQSSLYECLRRRLAGDPDVRVLLDRRRGERRQRRTWRAPERRQADRRRPTAFDRDVRFHWVMVCREPGGLLRDGDGQRSHRSDGGQQRMSITETTMTETRHQVERWIEESQYLLGRVIPGVFDDNQRLRDRLAAAQQDSERLQEEVAALRREIHELQSELAGLRGQHEHLRAEHASLAEALGRAIQHMTQMIQPINEMAARLQIGQPAPLEGAYQ